MATDGRSRESHALEQLTGVRSSKSSYYREYRHTSASLDRSIRAVGHAYKRLIEDWQHLLPAQSVCLTVPLVLPDEMDELSAVRRREWLGRYRQSRCSEVAAAAE